MLNAKIVGLLLIVVAIATAGFSLKSIIDERARLKAEVIKANSIIDNMKSVRAAETAQAEKVINTVKETETKYVTITKEVTKYVETHPAVCKLGAGWLRQYNSAIIGGDSPSPEVSDGATATDDSVGTDENAVLRNSSENYHACKVTSDKLLLLQEYVKTIPGIDAE